MGEEQYLQKEDLKRAFNCKICFEPFSKRSRYPISLNCGHTFCLVCVQTLSCNRVSIQCGICRKNTYSEARRLGKNIIVLELLEKLQLLGEDVPEEGEQQNEKLRASDEWQGVGEFVVGQDLESFHNEIQTVQDTLRTLISEQDGQDIPSSQDQLEELERQINGLQGDVHAVEQQLRVTGEAFNQAMSQLQIVSHRTSQILLENMPTNIRIGMVSPPFTRRNARFGGRGNSSFGLTARANMRIPLTDSFFSRTVSPIGNSTGRRFRRTAADLTPPPVTYSTPSPPRSRQSSAQSRIRWEEEGDDEDRDERIQVISFGTFATMDTGDFGQPSGNGFGDGETNSNRQQQNNAGWQDSSGDGPWSGANNYDGNSFANGGFDGPFGHQSNNNADRRHRWDAQQFNRGWGAPPGFISDNGGFAVGAHNNDGSCITSASDISNGSRRNRPRRNRIRPQLQVMTMNDSGNPNVEENIFEPDWGSPTGWSEAEDESQCGRAGAQDEPLQLIVQESNAIANNEQQQQELEAKESKEKNGEGGEKEDEQQGHSPSSTSSVIPSSDRETKENETEATGESEKAMTSSANCKKTICKIPAGREKPVTILMKRPKDN